MNFQLPEVGENKVFLVDFSEVSGSRLDPFYYIPDVIELEDRVTKVTSQKLRDFVLSMDGGATPSTKEAETHYTEKEDGVPFIRVQNLSTTGQLNLAEVRKISRETHEGLLLRSQLSGGELLVKITGVGRMAVASVVPECFEGNINQHLVAIRTQDKKTSETLAAYLNLDLAERLASRRSTGGTRPALDYPALLSLPVVFDERIPELINKAVERYKEKVTQAKAQLAQIDEILLWELGITPPAKVPDKVEDRCFFRDFSQVSGERLSAPSQWKKLNWQSPLFPSVPLVEVAHVNPLTSFAGLHDEDEVSFVPMDAVSDAFGEMHKSDTRVITGMQGYTVFQNEDLLWAKITPSMENGKSAVARDLVKGVGFGSTEFHVFRAKGNTLNIDFLHALFRLQLLRDHARLNFGGSAGHQRVDKDYFERLAIPLPPRPVQDAIVSQIQSLSQSAKALLALAQTELDAAKVAVEAMILGDN